MHMSREKHSQFPVVETEPWKPEKARKEGAQNNSMKEVHCLILTRYTYSENVKMEEMSVFTCSYTRYL